MLFRSVFPIVPLFYSFFLSAAANGQKPSSSFVASLMNAGSIGSINSENTIYLVNITLGGEGTTFALAMRVVLNLARVPSSAFTVQLDTGSTDLWVDGLGRNIRLTNSTTIAVNETYGQGSAFGSIAFAEMRLGDFCVPSQAFVNASEVRDMPDGIQGILGMAFDNASIRDTLLDAWGKQEAEKLGNAFITNVFAQSPSLPNNFDLQLGRVTFKDPAGTTTFTISDHAQGFEKVTQAPKLPRVATDHWTIALDEMHIDGDPFVFNRSIVPGAPDGKLLAVLDSGFSLPPLPDAAVNAIYNKIPGAILYNSPNAMLDGWIIPCDFNPVHLSFTFGGINYPVHPLDLFLPQIVPIVENSSETNVTVCVATYRASPFDNSAGFNTFDLILGDAFLRSVYASFDYSDFNPANNTHGEAFVQMLSTVDVRSAKAELDDFVASLRAQSPPFIEPSAFATKKLSPSVTEAAIPASTTGTADAAVRVAFDYETSSGSANSRRSMRGG